MRTTDRCVLALAFLAVASSSVFAADWWNASWKYRVPVSVNFGMAAMENPLIVARISREAVAKTVAGVDVNSFRLVDAQGAETPCVVRMDAGSDFYVAWRIEGKTDILETRKYFIYLDSKADGPKERKVYESLANVPAVLPGMNLIPNGDFAEVDAQGFPKEWNNTKGYGEKDKWTDAQKEAVKVMKADGKSCLRLAEGGHIMNVITGLEAGKQYKFSVLGKVDPGATANITVWFRRAGMDWFRNGIGNYKMGVGVSKPGDWARVETSTIIYADKNGNEHDGEKLLLPETRTAYVEISLYNSPPGTVAYLTDFRFELVGEMSEMKVKVGEAETGP